MRLGRVDLVDDDDVGHAEVRLARVVAQLVPGAKRVGDDNVQARPEERQVVVPAVPDHDVGLLLGLAQDLLVVDSRVHDHAHLDRKLVLLALLDRRVRGVDLLDRLEPLDAHRLEVAVRHRMPDERDLQAGVEQDPADFAARLALAAARADCADRDHGLRALEHRRVRAEEREVGACREDGRRLVHDRFVRQVGIGEDDLVHSLALDQVGELVLGPDRDAVRVLRPGERGRVAAVVDAGDLSRREGDDLGARLLAEDRVEVMEVAASRSHDDDLAHRSSFRRVGPGAPGPTRSFVHSIPASTFGLPLAATTGVGGTTISTSSVFRLSRHFRKT